MYGHVDNMGFLNVDDTHKNIQGSKVLRINGLNPLPIDKTSVNFLKKNDEE